LKLRFTEVAMTTAAIANPSALNRRPAALEVRSSRHATNADLPIGARSVGQNLRVSNDLHTAVRAVVDSADPVGLLASGAPHDEYDAEARDLMRLIESGNAPTADRVRAVMTRWFGSDTPISEAKIKEIADGLAAIFDRP
jgi:hypothetical protein